MTRKEERELAFTLIFEKIFNDDLSVEEIIKNAVEARLIEENVFACSLAQLTYDNRDEIDKLISEHSVGWKIERLPKVTLAIMRLAFCELLYVPSVPTGVSINEAVELAKKFASQEDASFINGILGKYVRENGL
ncbi:MAG: transcription antitermination factor NusB [Candidatus Fimenecus sp.]